MSMTVVTTSDRYRRFASAEARGQSDCYEAWANGVAGDEDLLALIDELPPAKRQPNLVFAAARLTGVEPGPFEAFRKQLISRWPRVREVIHARRTQTNEVGRSAVLLPILAGLPQPLALLEVGASAGLCLYPVRLSYQYGSRARLDPVDGPGPLLTCTVDGPVPIPDSVPKVVWRAGIDLNPLDVTDQDDIRWLETLVWPEHTQRRTQLAAAIEVARTDPPILVAGDLNETVDELITKAPSTATLVVFHSAVLAYLDRASRAAFVAKMQRGDAHWISNEGPGALPTTEGVLPKSPHPSRALFVVAHNGNPLAYADGHGRSLHWFG